MEGVVRVLADVINIEFICRVRLQIIHHLGGSGAKHSPPFLKRYFGCRVLDPVGYLEVVSLWHWFEKSDNYVLIC